MESEQLQRVVADAQDVRVLAVDDLIYPEPTRARHGRRETAAEGEPPCPGPGTDTPVMGVVVAREC
jgi:hypothetical protein